MSHKISSDGELFEAELLAVSRTTFLLLLGADTVKEIRNASSEDSQIALAVEMTKASSEVVVNSGIVMGFLNYIAASDIVPSFTAEDVERVQRGEKP